jgi:hypothetical protein
VWTFRLIPLALKMETVCSSETSVIPASPQGVTTQKTKTKLVNVPLGMNNIKSLSPLVWKESLIIKIKLI